MLVSLGPVLALVSQSHLEGTILPRGFFLGLGLIYLLALGLDRLCQRLRLPGAVAILLFGLLLQFVLGRYVAISAVHVESIHRVSLALLIFVAGLGTNLRLIRGGLATAASLCLLLPLLMWFCLSAGFLGVGVPLAAAALAGGFRGRPQPRQPGRLALCLQRNADATGALALLNTWMEEALGLGASVEDPPRQEPFGAEAWLLDPEGNRLLLLVLP